ncbi:MAG TPA: ABC transporter ATP-binding protein [Candidatus Paceibacterota bacterium]|jgi:ATP-binding cassette subfamily B protein|nr:ABC transporter ATP-binding protein [Candidatus Paceibacterota bacterium]
MQIFYHYLKKYWKLCALVLVLALINQFFSLLEPYITQLIIDRYATHFTSLTKSQFLNGVGLLILAFIGTALISRIAKNFQDYYLNTISQRSGADMYREGVKHSLALPYGIFEDERSGETLGKLQKARQDTEALMVAIVNTVFISLVIFIFIAIYSATIYWAIPIVFFAMVFIIGGVSLLMSKRIKSIQNVIVAETTALAGSTTESLRNIELVKSLGLTGQEVERLNTTTKKILKLELKKLRYLRSLDFVQGTITNAIRAGMIFFLLYLIYNRTITIGQYFSLNIYSFFLFFPLQQVAPFISMYRQAEASLANYSKLMEMPPEPTPATPNPIGEVKNLEFKNVSFGYKSTNENALSNIFYKISRGNTIAFVGPSGSGKTSLVKLLVGLYVPTEGEIYFNGFPFESIDKEELRRQIGFVTQDTQLFAGTIRENLLFVKPDATDPECLDALNKAQCQNLLERGGKGLDTVIGEGGVKVSGGEKQRLSIARALLRQPSILIFDEATSSLDSLTEEEITKTIRDVSTGHSRITILIAHRLSTIMHADTIYVLEKGKMTESGSHAELLGKQGLYSAMWRQQIGERA